MATRRSDILGDLNGKMGRMVFTTWKEIKVVKEKPKARIIKKDKAELPDQNSTLPIMSRFLSQAKELIAIGFKSRKKQLPSFQLAMRYNMDHALTGVAPDFDIDYSKVMISRGDRETAWGGEIAIVGKNKIRITWEIPETVNLKVIGRDFVRVYLYNSTDMSGRVYQDEVVRTALTFTTGLVHRTPGFVYHAWLFFVSPDGRSVSNSEYMGSVIMPEEPIAESQ